MTTRTRAAGIALAAAFLATATGFGGQGPEEEYVPFVTDFPRAAEPYVPFVTDFPRGATPPAAAPQAHGAAPDWSGLIVEGGVGATLAALLAGAGLVLVRRRNAAPRLNDC